MRRKKMARKKRKRKYPSTRKDIKYGVGKGKSKITQKSYRKLGKVANKAFPQKRKKKKK